MRNRLVLGQIGMHSEDSTRASYQGNAGCLAAGEGRSLVTGVTLIELLCVMAIICILASLLLPAVLRAYNRIKGAADELEAPRIAHMLTKETRDYCVVHPLYQFEGKADFSDKCVLSPKCRAWVQASSTDFVPFTYLDPTNRVVLSVHLGPKHATLYQFTKGDLSIRPAG